MNKEIPLRSPSLETIISRDALESLTSKLLMMNLNSDHQNEKSSMYQRFLKFIIDISQGSNPSKHFGKLFVNLFEGPPDDDPNDESSIKTILVCVLREDMLDPEDLKNLWRVMRDNADINSIVFEILSQSPNNNIKEIFVQNIISHVLDAPINEIKDIDYQMTSRIFWICTDSHELLHKQLDSFWQALSSAPMFDAVFHIQKARKLIESYPNTTDDKKLLSQKSVVRFLCKEKQLLNKVVRELESLIVKEIDLKDQKSSQINEMIQFANVLISSIPDCSTIITKNVIVSLWEIGLAVGGFTHLQGQLFLLIKQIIESRVDKDLEIEELIIFFKEKIRFSKDWISSKLTKEAFDCFRTIFITVNHHFHNISEVVLLASREEELPSRFEQLRIRKKEDEGCLEEEGDFLFQVDTFPNKLEGNTPLWELACLAKDQSVASKAQDFLVYLHTNLNIALRSQVKEIREEFLSICFKHLREMPLYEETSEYKIIRCLELLHSFIDQTNQDNPKRPKLHSELSKGELLKITVYPISDPMVVNSNILVFDLLGKVRQQFERNNLSIYLEEPSSKLIICENQNTRTLGDLGIQNNATLDLESRLLPEAYLIQYDKTLNPRAKLIFTKWFENYSDNQKMSPQQCANFFHSCTNDGCLPNDRRIVEVFTLYDDDKDGYLTLDNFLTFYHVACIKIPWVVRYNLLANKEASDLKPPKKKLELSADLNVASLINSNKEYLQVLFSLLESGDEIAVKSLQLLNRLPTDPQIFADIVMLKGVRDILNSDSVKPDWSYVLDANNIYKLFYCLNIIKYLMDSKRLDENEDEGESEDVKRLWSQEARLVEYKKSWFFDFVSYGGSECLNEVLGKLGLLKTSPTIETYKTRIKYLIEAIDKVHTLNMITTLTE